MSQAEEPTEAAAPIATFFGKAYRYNVPNEGMQTIGVCETMGGLFAVCWIKPGGIRSRLKMRYLAMQSKPERVQEILDQIAALHKLEEVKG